MLKKSLFYCVAILSCTLVNANEQKIISSKDSIAVFIPPSGWDIAAPVSLSPRIQAGFVKKVSSGFSPSINLAIEKIQCSKAQYLQAVKTLYEADRTTRWRDVGTFITKAGNAQLTEIDMSSKWGPIRLLQLLFIDKDTAYILTAAAPKKDFVKYQQEFQKALYSFTLSNDLWSFISSEKSMAILQKKAEQLKEICYDRQEQASFPTALWKTEYVNLEKLMQEHFADLGLHWQILMLRSILDQCPSQSQPKDA